MRIPATYDLPDELHPALRRAQRLEWLTIAYLLSAIALLYLTLGQSQAMKAAWVEDILSLLPPIAFLVALRFRDRPGDLKMPWGRHRAVTAGFLLSAAAILLLGAYLLLDSAMTLITGERPPIGTMDIAGWELWAGWPMIAALLWTGIPAVVLGRLKTPLADDLHDKVLWADAQMNRADWMTAAAAIVGVLGIGFGIWFADAAAAILIATDITRDGWRHVARAFADLLDERPATVQDDGPHPADLEVRRLVEATPWVRDALVRLREHGHLIAGEVIVVPADEDGVLARVEELQRAVRAIDWTLQDVTVVAARSIDR